MARSLTLMAAALALLAVACSDSTPSSSTSPLPITTTATTSTTTEPPTDPTSTAVTTTVTASTTTSPPPATTTSVPPAESLRVRLEEVVRVDHPVLVASLPGDPRLFVVDQPGQIWVVDDGEREVLLDLGDLVGFGGERGLLAMAFHPDFNVNRLFYVNYTNRAGDTVIAEYQMDESGVVDPETRRLILRVRQPAANHNGGMIAFDGAGHLLIAMGDGGGSNNQFRTAQNPARLNGSMLRIEVGPGSPDPYGVPVDNPYLGSDAGRDEVWATGLRNPWRFTVDGDRLYIADVGQNRIEEISVGSTAEPGLNFGWSVMEGNECFRSSDCDSSGLVVPVYTYGHGQGCSITGGVVYRGAELPEIVGHYFFADYCSGWVRSILVDDRGALVEEFEWPDLELRLPTGFGTDGVGEMYVVSQRGSVYRVVRSDDG